MCYDPITIQKKSWANSALCDAMVVVSKYKAGSDVTSLSFHGLTVCFNTELMINIYKAKVYYIYL